MKHPAIHLEGSVTGQVGHSNLAVDDTPQPPTFVPDQMPHANSLAAD